MLIQGSNRGQHRTGPKAPERQGATLGHMPVMRAPRALEILITSRCNLRCEYCSHFSSASDVGPDLPLGEWLGFFEELRIGCVMHATISGGEPFQREDWAQIIEGICRNRMRFSILSNGTLIHDEEAAFLSSTGRCDFIQISIDGGSARSHDVFRGSGTFDRAVAGIEALRRHGIAVQARVTVHRKNLDSLEGTVCFLLEGCGLGAISVNEASHFGLCRGNADRIQLGIQERARAMHVLLELQRRYPGRVIAAAGPLAHARIWLEMESARQNGASHGNNGGHLSGCHGVFSRLAVRSDGVIVPCAHLSHIELGRIRSTPLIKVWRDHPKLFDLRTRQALSLRGFPFCEGCKYVDFCSGGCPALAYSLLGEENHPSPHDCLRRFLELGGRLPPAGSA